MFIKNKPKNNKSLPDSVKQVLGDDENELELVKIPGNGACGMGSFAKHAFDDASLGPKIGEELNKDIAENFWYYKQLLEFPYSRPVGGSDDVKFEENEEEQLLDFLRNHPRNGFVWRGFMDMQALSNKYGMPIKIVSIKDINDTNPKIEYMEPDRDFEVMSVMEEMILLNTGMYHFDLIKKKKRTNTTDSCAKNLGDENIETYTNPEYKNDKDELYKLRCKYEELQKDVIKLKAHSCNPSSGKENSQIFQKSAVFEQEIQSGINDIEEIQKLSKKSGFRRTGPQSQAEEKVDEPVFKCVKCNNILASKGLLETHIQEKHEPLYECDICVFRSKSVIKLEQHKENVHNKNNTCNKCRETFTNDDHLKKHMEIHEQKSRREEFNCDTCDFQNTKRNALKNHLERSPGHKPCSKTYECRNCKTVFSSYYHLMTHKNNEHPTNKTCRYFKDGKCHFSASECWYKHDKIPEGERIKVNENMDFQAATKNLPPDMRMLIDQIIKISSKTMN